MPFYSYLCKDCGEKFELLIGVVSEKTELKCTGCGSKNIEKTFAPFSVGKGSLTSSREACPEAPCCPARTCPTGTCPIRK